MDRRSLLLGAALVALAGRTGWAQSPPPFDFDKELARARQAGRELRQSELARLGLVLFANSMLAIRTNLQPLGYEKGPEFQLMAREMRQALQELLLSPDARLPDVLEPPGSAIEAMQTRYKKNFPDIPKFLEVIKSSQSTITLLQPQQILRHQLTIAVLIAARKESVWQMILRGTGCFPFC